MYNFIFGMRQYLTFGLYSKHTENNLADLSLFRYLFIVFNYYSRSFCLFLTDLKTKEGLLLFHLCGFLYRSDFLSNHKTDFDDCIIMIDLSIPDVQKLSHWWSRTIKKIKGIQLFVCKRDDTRLDLL